MWHSCSSYTLDHHFDGKDPRLRELFDAWLAFVEQFGKVAVIPQKTRISFQDRVRFAGAIVAKRSIDCGFWLKRPLNSPRFKQEHIPPRDWVYRFRLEDESQLDEELREIVREAWSVGRQEPRLPGAASDRSD